MNGLMKYPVAESTERATEGIDNIIANNRADYEASLPQPKPEATIGPTPWMETDEGQQTLMDIAMGSAGAGPAIGRISKATVTGGQVIKETLKRMAQKSQKAPTGWGKRGKNWGAINAINYHNKINAARLRAQKILDKYGITHPDNLRQGSKYKPSDYPEVPLEPTIRMILNKIKEN